ncbi:uncharacterized protein ZK643.6-like isoform X2 [Bolinopsis microptera]|uniref:uncharacterized protein ZK643.6-like isoform X2 n=1 Tax=Bolinopsis microptera TaxID=2820187 RepID=UPI00307AAE49
MLFVFATSFFFVAAAQGCQDKQSYCASYALIGSCMKPDFYSQCQLSCGACVCTDALKKDECVMLRDQGKCLSNYQEMERNCKATCGFCGCRDESSYNCATKAAAGQCITDKLMVTKCPLSCKLCGDCGDNTLQCVQWAAQGNCATETNKMITHCPGSCGICECADGPGMEGECARRAALGECESNISYTYTHCAATCNLCPSGGGGSSDSDSGSEGGEEEEEEEENVI